MVVLCDSERERRPPCTGPPNLIMLCSCRLLFPLRRRDDLFGQIVQLALLLFRCINCNYWPNGANRLQIAFRESCLSRISTYCSYGKISGESCNSNKNHVEHSCRCCPEASFSVLGSQFPNNNYRKLTSFHQRQERSFPELPVS